VESSERSTWPSLVCWASGPRWVVMDVLLLMMVADTPADEQLMTETQAIILLVMFAVSGIAIGAISGVGPRAKATFRGAKRPHGADPVSPRVRYGDLVRRVQTTSNVGDRARPDRLNRRSSTGREPQRVDCEL
jgi:hypothetical protein